MSNHNRYYEPIEQSYSITLRARRMPNFRLWTIVIDHTVNVNKRIAALRLYVDNLPLVPGLDADDWANESDCLRVLSARADEQGARALADVAFDLADELADDADYCREYERCGGNLNIYYGTPRH